jgi:hypothetical protein
VSDLYAAAGSDDQPNITLQKYDQHRRNCLQAYNTHKKRNWGGCMGVRFRQRVKLFPGVHLNVSRGGVSVSIGGPGGTVNIDKRGKVKATVGIPGTGLSYSKTLRPSAGQSKSNESQGQAERFRSDALELVVQDLSSPTLSGKATVGSASTQTLANAGMLEVQRLTIEAHKERKTLEVELSRMTDARNAAEREVTRLEKWYLRFLFKKQLEAAKSTLEAAKNSLEEINEDLKRQGLTIDWTLPPELRSRYQRLIEDCRSLKSVGAIWHITNNARIDRVSSRASYDTVIDRKRGRITEGRPTFLLANPQDEWPSVPCLRSDAGLEIYIFPSFLLFCRQDGFAILDPKDIEISVNDDVRVVEHERLPNDAQIVDHNWRYSNKDGTRDQRFKDNYQNPVVSYEPLELRSESGLNEQFLFTKDAFTFARALNEFCEWFRWVAKCTRLEQEAASISTATTDPVGWQFRKDDDANDSYYFIKHWRASEFFAFVLQKKSGGIWASAFTKHLGFQLGRGSSLKVWVDDQPLFDFSDGDSNRFVDENKIGFVTWYHRKDDDSALSLLQKILYGQQMIVNIKNGDDHEISALLDMNGLADIFYEALPEYELIDAKSDNLNL